MHTDELTLLSNMHAIVLLPWGENNAPGFCQLGTLTVHYSSKSERLKCMDGSVMVHPKTFDILR
jgi:hypothetical protein